MSQKEREIRVFGAKTHNLKNVDVCFPRQKLNVVTGVSGSGKSSLAFDTVFREGQRRYLETIQKSNRTSIPQLGSIEVERIEGLPPVIGISQRGRQFQLRSTVGTLTEIDDHIRVLFANAGRLYCPQCAIPVRSTSVANIVREVLQGPERQKLMVLAPANRSNQTVKDQLARFQKEGFVRVRIGNEVVDIAESAEMEFDDDIHVDAVVDRIILKEGVASRLQESIETAVRVSDGSCIVSVLDNENWRDQHHTTTLQCSNCPEVFEQVTPQSLSFKNSRGACRACEGLGIPLEGDVKSSRRKIRDVLRTNRELCPACNGSRLNPIAAGVRFSGISLAEFNQLSIESAAGIVDGWLAGLDGQVNSEKMQLQQTVLPKILSRLRFLREVGLGYLTLNRAAATLSGGEYQRTRLAACLGTSLTGVCYILDEPTNGLHVADTQKLLCVLHDVRSRGNTVIAVEHQIEFISEAEHIVDLGPGAGRYGGEVMVQGSPTEIAETANSVTGRFLQNDSRVEALEPKPTDASITIQGARLHNLKDIDAQFPLNRLTCVTGLSGSGKSSLVLGTLAPAILALLESRHPDEISKNLSNCKTINGWQDLQGVVVIDQSPIGKNNRSCPATLTGIWDDLRKLFAKTKMARLRGFTPRRFSFNNPEGRCPSCRGLGTVKLKSDLSAQTESTCPACQGLRFNPLTLGIQFRGRSIGDILRMTIEEAVDFFENIERVCHPLRQFKDLGLGYLQLGQPASTLSGGESQRAKLVAGLAKSMRNHLVVMDEPTQGLHPADVDCLIRVINQLLDSANTVVCIEHNIQLVQYADWLIDLGPEGGENGGTVIVQGTPQDVANSGSGKTAKALKRRF